MVFNLLYHNSHTVQYTHRWEGRSEIANPPLQSARYAVANFVDSFEHMYGVFSIHNQLIKYNMSTTPQPSANTFRGGLVTHVAVVSSKVKEEHRNILASWLGGDNVRIVDTDYILNRLRKDMWPGVFNKLWFFNLTEFDKVITLDADILIRRNIMHWFDYATPCGIQAGNINTGNDINWNSGAMVIRPDTKVFNEMLSELPNISRYDNTRVYERDPLHNSYGQQGVITSFFLRKNDPMLRCVMPTEAAVLSSSLDNGGGLFGYYSKYHPYVYQTVHFTVHKPWRDSTKTQNSFICLLLLEWAESVGGIEKYDDKIEPLKYDYGPLCANMKNHTPEVQQQIVRGYEVD